MRVSGATERPFGRLAAPLLGWRQRQAPDRIWFREKRTVAGFTFKAARQIACNALLFQHYSPKCRLFGVFRFVQHELSLAIIGKVEFATMTSCGYRGCRRHSRKLAEQERNYGKPHRKNERLWTRSLGGEQLALMIMRNDCAYPRCLRILAEWVQRYRCSSSNRSSCGRRMSRGLVNVEGERTTHTRGIVPLAASGRAAPSKP